MESVWRRFLGTLGTICNSCIAGHVLEDCGPIEALEDAAGRLIPPEVSEHCAQGAVRLLGRAWIV